MGGLTLSQKEQARLQVLNQVLQGLIGVEEAAQVLGVSERHTWRILAAYREEGAAALTHGNRGRRPANATSEDIKLRVITLARTHYAEVNHTHLAELLGEREGLILARSTLHGILRGDGICSPRRRSPPRHRCRRQRMPLEGMLVQIDGSEHDWLEVRGPGLTLLLAVDDATGTVPYAIFREQEDTWGYFLLFQGIIERRGIPVAVYGDRHAIFCQSRRRILAAPDLSPEEKEGLTQFGRAMQELGVTQIAARSPEAKGRIERMAGTFQDRLVTELRLAGSSSLDEANRVLWEFLPGFNTRFGVPPAQPQSAYRPLAPDLELAETLCFKHRRTVARDNTVRYNWHTLQLLPGADHPSYSGAHVEVQERLDGSLVVYYQGRLISTREAPPRPGVLRSPVAALPTAKPVSSLLRLAGGVRSNIVGSQELGSTEEWSATCNGAAADSLTHGNTEETPLKVSDTSTPTCAPPREPTPCQKARWKAIQKAKRRGLSLRAIARYLGVSRNTVRKYVRTDGPPAYPARRTAETSKQMETVRAD